MPASAETPRKGLSGLSVELLFQIAGQLERSDLKSLRLMNRTIRDVASERMFESICVGFEPSALRQLENVSKCPYWAAQVRLLKWITASSATDRDGDFELVSNYLQQLSSVESIFFSEYDLYLVPGLADFLRQLAQTLRRFVRPLTLEIDNVTMTSKYNSNGNLEEADISCLTHDAPALGLPVLHQLFVLLFEHGQSTTTKLSITGIEVQARDFSLFKETNLMDLTLSNVVLAASEEEGDPLGLFFSALKHRASLSPDPPMRVTLTDIDKHGHTGTMSATNKEITACINDDGGPWLAEKQALFTQYQDLTYGDDVSEYWERHNRDYYGWSDDDDSSEED